MKTLFTSPAKKKPAHGALYVLFGAACAMLIWQSTAFSQGISGLGENTDSYRPPKTGWIADSLYIGATFLRDTTQDSFVIWLHRNEAGCQGSLYLMVPKGSSSGMDTSIFLFKNFGNGGAPLKINLSKNSVVTNHIHHLDTLFFRYHVIDAKGNGCDNMYRFTGPNRAPGDGWLGTDRYYSQAKTQCNNVKDSITSLDGTKHCIGRRWSAAGWIRDIVHNTRTDTVEFGFEDLIRGDNDFDDIVFHVYGVFLIKPSIVSNIRLDAQPSNDTIFAGDSVRYRATVVLDSIDSFGIHHVVEDSMYRANRITWIITGDTTGGRLINGLGPIRNNIFTATRAWRTYTIQATIVDGDKAVSQSLTVYVKPTIPKFLTVEQAPVIPGTLPSQVPRPIDTLTLGGSAQKDSVYAVLRDRYGNFISASQSTTWGTIPDTVTISVAKGDSAKGEGVVHKKGPAGTARVWAHGASYGISTLFADTFTVKIDTSRIIGLRFVVGQGGQKRIISSLNISLARDTLLYAEGRREDGVGGDNYDGWIPIATGWTLSTPFTSQNALPAGSSASWRFLPINDTGRGTIGIRYGSQTSVLTVQVTSGIPSKFVLYPASGMPDVGSNIQFLSPLAFTYQWSAGRTFTLVGKVFDAWGHWLSTYESSNAAIGWELRTKAGILSAASGEFSPVSGAQTIFTPKRAGDTLNLIATFTTGSIVMLDTIRLTISAGVMHHILIEPQSGALNPNQDNPLSDLEFLDVDTTRTAWAVVRDRYGNFIENSIPAIWKSIDTLVVTVTSQGNGSGVIRRKADTHGVTYITAQQNSFIDSLKVTVDSISYTALRLTVRQNGPFTDIDNLSILVSQDTTLYALGRRSDNGQWVQVAVPWLLRNVALTPLAPAAADRYSFTVQDTATGYIVISKGVARDSVKLVAGFPPPALLTLYPHRGLPNVVGNMPYPPVNTPLIDTAGYTISLSAKLFGANGMWLKQYEAISSPIQWSTRMVSGVAPAGSFSTLSGDTTSFTITKAFTIVDIIASFTASSGAILSDIIRVSVNPGSATHLSIEAKPSEPYETPFGTINIGQRDTVGYAYAVLRDRYGNRIQPDTSVQFTSNNSAIAAAIPGIKNLAEVKIIRRLATEGSTKIIAQSLTNPLWKDTLDVVLAAVSYDSLRIVIMNGATAAHITELILPTDQDTSLSVQGKRSDNQEWESVNSNWQTTGSIFTTPDAPASASSFKFTPSDTGIGYIKVVLTSDLTAKPDSVRVWFIKGRAMHMALFPDTGAPHGITNRQFTGPDTALQVIAGDTLHIAGKLFDHQNRYLSDTKVNWTILELSGTSGSGILSDTITKRATFIPTKARNQVLIIGTWRDSLRGDLRDTIRISVVPRTAYALYIEANADWQLSPNAPAPIDTVKLTKFETYRQVYAVVRDTFGNFIDYSQTTVWNSRDSSLVVGSVGIASLGQGTLEKTDTQNRDTTTVIIAQNTGNRSLVDSVYIHLVNIYFTELRIVRGNDTVALSDISISTNDTTTLTVIGRRSDNGQWMPVVAQWGTSPGLQVSPVAPDQAASWTFSPNVPSTGFIWVTLNSDSTRADTIPVNFTRGKPTSLSMTLLTRPENMIAGDTITAILELRNADGLVPGTYCDSSTFYSALGSGSVLQHPVIITDEGSAPLTQTGTVTPKLGHCFSNGYDTVKMVLYNAPYGQQNNQSISTTLSGANIKATTQAFTLKPNTLAIVRIENSIGGTPVPDSVSKRAPSEYLYIFAVGYDRFGNTIGGINSDWRIRQGATLHPISSPYQTQFIYYSTQDVFVDEQGWIDVTANSNPGIGDSLYVVLKAPPVEIVKATTRDVNGDGFLDHIEVVFSKPIDLDTGAYATARYGSTSLDIDSLPLGHLRSFTVRIDTNTAKPWPQTSFKPILTIFGVADAENESVTKTCIDGAGPVITAVYMEITESENRKTDVVTVAFSERVQSANNGSFSLSMIPDSLFKVWQKTGTEFLLVQDMLDSIIGLSDFYSDSVVKFVMTNGEELTSNYYFSIRRVPEQSGNLSTYLTDRPTGNLPHVDNHKQQVKVLPTRPSRMSTFPNPAPPAPGMPALTLEYDPNARQNAVSKGGTVLSVPFLLIPNKSPDRVDGDLKIFDLIGNVVAHQTKEDMLQTYTDKKPNARSTGGMINYDIYWNCQNDRKMNVSPGVYRAVLYLNYHEGSARDKMFTSVIGVGR